MGDETKSKTLASEILADAQKQAERKTSSAKKTAERIVHSAQAQVENIEQDAIKQAQKRLDHQSRLIQADIPHQKQIRTLQVKQQVIDAILNDAIKKMLSNDSQHPDALLIALAAMSVEQILSDDIVLELSQRDAARGENIIRALKAKYASKTFKAATNANIKGGVIARSANGRQIVNNTFESRLLRTQHELRNRLAKLIFGETQA